ncbi:MAG: zinc ribbon domain-containing protein [Acidobacteria bacterium]|nr:zinc ribbon domain-containing protein [Acidobacteriota bacterium]
MWTCVSCGETENEDDYKFCFACGAAQPAAPEGAPEGRPGPPQTREISSAEPEAEQQPDAEEQEHGFKLPKALTSLGQRLRHAASAGDDHVINVRVSAEAQEAVELLLQAGRFDNPADAAGFFLEEGVKAQAELLWVIQEKLSEIERLRAELKGLGGSR